MAGITNEYLSDHKLFRTRNKKILFWFPLIAILVAIAVFWCLKLIGITVTSDTLCGIEEHIHSVDCYSEQFVNDFDVTQGISQKILICTKPEHTHSQECFPDQNADIETASDWTKSFENVELTNNVAKNIFAIASSQIGYKESLLNYEYDENAEKNGYTRYGAWYGNPYGKWNTMFVSFCINYANVNDSDKLVNASPESMRLAWQEKGVYAANKKYTCSIGDIVFFDINADDIADRTGIVMYLGDNVFIVAEGDVDGAVDKVIYENTDLVMGYGTAGKLYTSVYITENTTEHIQNESQEDMDISGELNHYIPGDIKLNAEEQIIVTPNVFNSDPLIHMFAENHNIDYTSHLENEVVNAVFKEQSGDVINNSGTVYIGETYTISLEFSEINTGDKWIQFRHNDDGYLTYHIPDNLRCEPFETWHTISATTENGTIEDVGEYFVDENNLLKVRFFNDVNNINFVDKYSNVDFTLDFNATVAATQSGSLTEIKFNDNINVNLNIDGGAGMSVTKTHGEYDANSNTLEYTIRVEATHGVVKDLVIDDQIWENHYALRDTIEVTDLDGNLLDPQPTIQDHPNIWASGGFSLSNFPNFSAGHGFLIKYKSSIYNELLSNETVDMWNGLDSTGKNSNGDNVYVWSEDWTKIELKKMEKDGKQSVLEDDTGKAIPVIEWEIEIRKTDANLQGTVIIDTLGDGLSYYTKKPIQVKRYDERGNRLTDSYINWNDVTINGNTMEFALPDSHACVVVYYTSYEELDEGETKKYTNSAKVTINGKEEQTTGSADVVGFVPHIQKSASGNDGKYVYFTINADVPAVIKDWGHFYLTDLTAFWGYQENSEGYLYVENIPEDLIITATTESGQTINFTPYREGGTIENTYILVTPSIDNGHHSFNILFNTADVDLSSSKWILNEDSTLNITYKTPFNAKTGVEWEGTLSGNQTLEDVLLSGYKLTNEAYLNYTNVITGTSTSTYEYSPKITKKSVVHEDGTIDYTVVFNNTIPGSGGNKGYIDGTIDLTWFTDTFDERMQYVPGSLVVTGYSPWQKDLWLAKYKYNGTIDGNTINASSTDFSFLDYNEEANAYGWNNIANTATFKNYYRWINAGGKFVFTYTLKVKDEYFYTNQIAELQLDNTAEFVWDNNGSSGPVTDTVKVNTGLVEKTVVQKDTKLDFDIHINRNALDILKDIDTLIIEDTMTPNLSVYWKSIKLLYEDESGNWIDFTSTESQHTYTVTYDPPTNTLTFVIPDNLHVKISYTTLMTESGLVSVNNSVSINGKAEISDLIDALFRVEEHSGGASGSNHDIMLLKQDGVTDTPLQGAKFLLYGPMGDPNATLPEGASQTLVTDDGKILKFIGVYTTGQDGTVYIETQYLTIGGPYAFVEQTAPLGYERLTNPVYFYFYETDPNNVIQTVTTLIVIENFSGTFLFPETGSNGLLYMATIGIALLAFPILYNLIRSKRERRLKLISAQ